MTPGQYLSRVTKATEAAGVHLVRLAHVLRTEARDERPSPLTQHPLGGARDSLRKTQGPRRGAASPGGRRLRAAGHSIRTRIEGEMLVANSSRRPTVSSPGLAGCEERRTTNNDPPRSLSVVSPASATNQRELLERAGAPRQQRLSDWIRAVLVRAARQQLAKADQHS